MKTKKRTHCEVCRTKLGDLVIELPGLPLSECLFDKPTKLESIDQEFYFCDVCEHGQLGIIVDGETLYKDYAYRTDNSINKERNNLVKEMIEKLGDVNTIIDIGCNDLYLLKSLKGKVKRLIGIDPYIKTEDEDIEILDKFAEDVNWKDCITDNSIIVSIHNIEHIEEPRKLIENMMNAVKTNAIFIFEFPCLEHLIKEKRFDRIFHQHYHYFTSESFQLMVRLAGGRIHSCKYLNDDWGSVRVIFSKEQKIKTAHVRTSYNEFLKTMNKKAIELEKIKDEKTLGFGSILTLPVLNYHLMNTLNYCDNFVDIDINKTGKYFPNIDNPIILSKNDLTDINVIITAISFNDKIKENVKKLNPKRIIELK